ncbi:MAG: DUF4124 domain-containing protein [Gammaproteobacteria bacterium]|nr:DUF4124 domain-containing protein [Gammaproteobacteria bacterium]
MRRIFVLLALLAGSASGDINRCTDENGAVSFTDLPCPNAEIVELKSPAGTYAPQNEEVEIALKIITGMRQRAEGGRAEKAQRSADARDNAETCARQLSYIEELRAGGYFFREDDPDRGAMTDEEILAEIAKNEEQYHMRCSSTG